MSGGAPLSEAEAQCFIGLGLPLLQGYGMTESSPVVSVNRLEDNWPITVGRPLPGVQTRIGENNELQVRGENVMKGYWKRPEDTAKAMTADGWLRTGVQSSLDGVRVRILGRIKEIIVTSTCEKIALADLELAITSDPFFDQAYVIGDNHPFITAFVVLHPAQWKALGAAKCGGSEADDAALNQGPACEIALAHIKEACKRFPHYAVPRVVWCTLEPWTIENAMMTPTLKLKLKLNNLAARYATRIDAIYGGQGG
ncbi:MAG: AMP-binding protein [Candidatus Protistobacter heckmanni]|nr:AMP-binding protein [Candidatus Protistobacter heckmanni]